MRLSSVKQHWWVIYPASDNGTSLEELSTVECWCGKQSIVFRYNYDGTCRTHVHVHSQQYRTSLADVLFCCCGCAAGQMAEFHAEVIMCV